MAFGNRWPWFDERLRLQDELLRVFAPALGSASAGRSAGVFPPVNLYDNGEAFLVRAEVPGVSKDTLEVTARGDELVVRGERTVRPVTGKVSYHRRECESGKFSRTVVLPSPVDSSKIAATYKNGVLEVVLPRVPEAQPRKINVH